MSRRARTPAQKLIYSAVYRCRQCGLRIEVVHGFLTRLMVRGKFLLSGHSRCVRCATYSVTALRKRDHIDPIAKNLLGRMQVLLGAPLKHCVACRLQYYDWRPVRAESPD